jgi:hypothetical protein
MQHKPMTGRQKQKALDIFRAMSKPAEPDRPRRPEDDVIEALEADAALHESAAEECRRTATLIRERQRLGDVRRMLRPIPNPAPEE